MHILYLHQYFKFPHESGGTRSYDLATGFAELGNKVEIITSTSEVKYNTKQRWTIVEYKNLVIHFIYLPYGNHLSYFRRSLVFFKFLWFSIFKLISLKADIILASSTPLTIGIPALIKKWLHGTPFIFEVRDVWPEAVIAIGALRNKLLQNFLYKLEYTIYKNADAIVPLSVDMKRSIVSRFPQLNSKPIKTIENIAEINRFQNGYCSKSILKEKIGFVPRFTILYAGTFGRVNGINYVITLAEKLIHIDPTIVFVLIGNGAEKEMIIEKAKNKAVLNKNVFILDAISKQELPQLYFESAMGSSFVIPIKELWANSANKFFDTLAAGRPILINHKGWQKEIIENEKIGYILPEEMDAEAVKKFVLYTQNIDLILTQGENALRIAKEKYALERAIVKYNKLFNIIRNKYV